MRSRPDIAIEVPARVAAGDFDVIVTLTSYSRTPVNGVHLHVEEVRSLTGDGDQAGYLDTRHSLLHRVLIAEGGELDPGPHRFETQVRLPPTARETQKGPLFKRVYRARVEVDIPLWPDASAEQTFVVAAPLGPAPAAPEPFVATFPRIAGAMVLEVALEDRRAAPGEVIAGTMTFGSIGDFDFAGASVHLQLTEEVEQRNARGNVDQSRWWVSQPATFVTLTRVTEGEPVRFALPVPRDLQPSVPRHPLELDGVEASSELSWALVVRVDSTGGAHALPLEIGRWEPRQPSTAPPVVTGRDRWRRAWADLGRAHGLSLSPAALELTGELHGARAVVREAQDGARGVLASLYWDRGAFGLQLRKRGLLDGAGIRFDEDPEFDHFSVQARIPERARAWLSAALRAALVDATRLGTVEVLETTLVLCAPVAAQQTEALVPVVSALAALAEALEQALDEMPPPPNAAALVEPWRAFAERRGARVFLGAMQIRSVHVDGGDFSLESVLDERSMIMATVLALEVSREDWEARRWEPGVRTQIAALERDARKVSFEQDRLQLRMPGVAPDPEALSGTFTDMLVLARLLRGERGPRGYR